MSMREKIAAALAGVTYADHPLDAHEVEPRTLSALQAWPVWVNTRWLTACTWSVEWAVVVMLPAADTDAWTEAAEDLIQPVRDALEAVGHVDLAEAMTVQANDIGQNVPALRFTLTTSTS